MTSQQPKPPSARLTWADLEPHLYVLTPSQRELAEKYYRDGLTLGQIKTDSKVRTGLQNRTARVALKLLRSLLGLPYLKPAERKYFGHAPTLPPPSPRKRPEIRPPAPQSESDMAAALRKLFPDGGASLTPDTDSTSDK